MPQHLPKVSRRYRQLKPAARTSEQDHQHRDSAILHPRQMSTNGIALPSFPILLNPIRKGPLSPAMTCLAPSVAILCAPGVHKPCSALCTKSSASPAFPIQPRPIVECYSH